MYNIHKYDGRICYLPGIKLFKKVAIYFENYLVHMNFNLSRKDKILLCN